MDICPKCSGSGYLTENGQFIRFCECSIGNRVRSQIWEHKLTEAAILKEYWNLKFKDFYPQPSYVSHVQFVRDLEAYLKNISQRYQDGYIWLVCGDVGVGKTLGASLILKEALKKDYSAMYIIWTDLVDQVFTDEGLIEKLRDTDFLAVDDLGRDKTNKNSSSKYTEDLLEKIIKPRFSSKKPTILLSSKAHRELCMKYPVLTAMLSPQNVSEVSGMNFRTNQRQK